MRETMSSVEDILEVPGTTYILNPVEGCMQHVYIYISVLMQQLALSCKE
jgi:hypothetical protein